MLRLAKMLSASKLCDGAVVLARCGVLRFAGRTVMAFSRRPFRLYVLWYTVFKMTLHPCYPGEIGERVWHCLEKWQDETGSA